MSFNDPDSPLYPYRYRHFDEGLADADRQILSDLQESGDCHGQIYDLMIDGFFGLHPHLKPLIRDRDRYFPVYARIRGSFPAMQQRCVYYQAKNDLEKWFDVTSFAPFDGTYGIKPNGHEVRDATWFLARSKWRFWTFQLARLAFCQGYAPSIRDVWAQAGRPGGISYTAEEAIYLAGQAAARGLLSNVELAVEIELFRRSGLGLSDIHRLVDEARSHRLHEMHFVRGNWQLVCREWNEQETQ